MKNFLLPAAVFILLLSSAGNVLAQTIAVSGASATVVDGIYAYESDYQAKAVFRQVGGAQCGIFWTGTQWCIRSVTGAVHYYYNSTSTSYFPPTGAWQIDADGGSSAPTLTAYAPSGGGTSGNPYLIATLADLNWLTQTSSAWSGTIKQTADIDASSTSSWDGGAGFSPIGNGPTMFTGSYDGQTYKITGLFISRSATDYIGLFGYTDGATITNVKLDNVQITGETYVGGLIGQLYNSSTATHCYSSGSVTGAYYVGGLIGFQRASSIVTTCYSSGSVTGGSDDVGGLIGYQFNSSTATKCYSSGSVTGGSYVGGLIGLQDVNSNDNNCYSTGSVTGVSDVGGLIGDQGTSSVATNCYSSGSVTGSGLHVFGLIGDGGSGSSANNCFWDMTSSGQTSSSGGTGKSTAQMKTASTFTDAGWSGTVWFMDIGINNGYPYLAWQNPGGTAIHRAGNCVSFDGTGYISTVASSTIAVTTAVTIEAMIKPVHTGDDQEVVRLRGDGYDDGCEIQISDDGNVQFNANLPTDENHWCTAYSSSVNVFDGLWHHVVGVVDASNVASLYVDGVFQASSSGTGPIALDGNGYVYIGEHPTSPSHYYYSGLIDEVRVSNNVRYTSNFTRPTLPFTSDANTLLLFHFDESSGTTTADASDNGNMGTLNGGVTFTSSDAPLPVELTSFTATPSNSSIILVWKTATEVNNYGFEVQRRVVSSSQALASSWGKIGFVQGNSTSNAPHEYGFTDPKLSSGSFAYRLKQVDNNGAFKYSQETEVTIEAPKVFALSQNYPNPFNPSTMISFDLPTKSFVSLKIFDLLGREVATIVSEEMSTGSHVKQWNAENCPSGVYFYRLQAGSLTETKRMILMK